MTEEEKKTSQEASQVKLDAEVRLEIRDEVERRVKQRIEDVEDNYAKRAKIFIGAVIVVNAVIIAALAFIGISTWNDAKEKFLNSTDVAKRTKEINDLNNEATNIFSQMNETFSEYTNRLAELRGLDNIVTSEELKAKVSTIDRQIQTVNELAAQSQITIKQVKDASDFYFSLTDARNYRRSGFDNLRKVALDGSNAFSERAKSESKLIAASVTNQVISTQIVSSNGQITIIGNYVWKNGGTERDVSKVTFAEAKNECMTAETLNASWLLYFIVNNPNYPKAEKMNFVMQEYRESENLFAVFTAESILKSEAKLQDLPPFSYEQIDKWWQENQSKYPAN